MKKNFLLAMALATLCSCSGNSDKEDVENKEMSELIEKVKNSNGSMALITIDGENNKTRGMIAPVNYSSTATISFAFENNENIAVYSEGASMTNYYTMGSGTSAPIKSSGFRLKDNAGYYAFYPYNPDATDKTSVPFDVSHQVMDASNSTANLASYYYMCSEQTVASNGYVFFMLKPIVGFIYARLRIQNFQGNKITKIKMFDMQNPLVVSGTIDLTVENYSYSTTLSKITPSTENTIEISMGNSGEGVIPETSSTYKQIYVIAAIPMGNNIQQLNITAYDDMGNIYSGNAATRNTITGTLNTSVNLQYAGREM